MTISATDTIAALATAPGEGAISIVRISGPESLLIADRLFRGKAPPPSQRPAHSFARGSIVSDNGVADEVILLIYRAPHSYTREDSVEIQGHGGSAAAKRILRAVLAAGARMAEPGEFTKRAFLSGRIDLLQAEAVLDLIRARSDRAADAALEQMNGTLSKAFDQLYDHTLALAANLEATLDFSDDELPESFLRDAIAQRASIETEFKRLLDSWDEGHLLREGARVVIAGKPNVGKSTLLNTLVGKERAIVTPIPGTTRDTIEELVVICGYSVRLIDTAGLRVSPCEIEQEGVSRARQAIYRADCNVYVVDLSQGLDEEDWATLSTLDKHKTILALNKSDLIQKETVKAHKTHQSTMTGYSKVFISAKCGTGINSLKEAIIQTMGVSQGGIAHAAISERHRHLLVSAHKEVVEAGLLLTRPTPAPDLAASRLRGALETLGEVTGRVYHDELLNNIFNRFCIGK